MSVTDLYKENIAKLRLYNHVLKENFIDETHITIALTEFYRLLGFFVYSTRWEHCMSDVHDKIWKLAAIDTYYYRDICNYACRLAGHTQQMIHYEPDTEQGVGRTADRKLFTYLQYINLFLRVPNRLFWSEVNVNVSISRPIDLLNLSNLFVSSVSQQTNMNSTENQNTASQESQNATGRESQNATGRESQNATGRESQNTTSQENQDIYLTSDDENIDKFNVKAINVHTSIHHMVTVNKDKKAGHLYRKVAEAINKNVYDIKLLMNGTILRSDVNLTDIFKEANNIVHVVIKAST